MNAVFIQREYQKARGDYQMNMELQYEHINWSDIAEAELSGDQETLRMLRSVSHKWPKPTKDDFFVPSTETGQRR